jgi:hypothetical protein
MKLSFASLLPGAERGWKSMHPLCALPSCQVNPLMRRGRAGIAVDRQRYCSVECFAIAARKRFRASLSANAVETPHEPRRSIGHLMLSKGFLTGDQLQRALAQSHRLSETLDLTLLRLGLASERQLAAARAAQWGCPVLGQDGVGQRVVADIPPTLLDTYSAVPLHASLAAKRLLLGFVVRVEHSLLHSLEQMTGMRAEPCFITRADRKQQLRHLTHTSNCEEIVFDDPSSPAEMATNVAGFALEIAAQEARFAHCRSFVWTRLTGQHKKIDVLFRIGSPKQTERNEHVPGGPGKLHAIG